MIQVLQIIVKKNDKIRKEIDNLCFKSKNLYNKGLYEVRQYFFNNNKYLNYFSLEKLMKDNNDTDYRNLPIKSSQQTLKLLDQNFKSFFNANKDYKVNPNKYLGKPKLPKYLNKDGRYVVKYTYQGISKVGLRNGYIKPEKSNLYFNISKFKNIINEDSLCEVRLIPRSFYYIVEIVYDIKTLDKKIDNKRYASIDLGVSNLCSISSNTTNQSFIINGRALKSINQYYNKKKSHYLSKLKKVNDSYSSKRLERLTLKRNNKVKNYLHKTSLYITNFLVSQNINTIIIGNNKNWKQNVNIGKINNQNFTNIPHTTLINILTYKCEILGINVIVSNESYTSKCSFLDNEKICKHSNYMGKRIKRGLFKSSKDYLINADVNGSLNILRKVVPNAFVDIIKEKGIEDFVVNPVIININEN